MKLALALILIICLAILALQIAFAAPPVVAAILAAFTLFTIMTDVVIVALRKFGQ